MSYLIHLQCSECGEFYDPCHIQTYCLRCQSPLLARYDLRGIRRSLDRETIRVRPRGMWRWHELLPVTQPKYHITLGEGDTPLLPLFRLGEQLGFQHLFIKDESLNPTGTFKARGLAAAISKACELGIRKVIIPTAGNAGGAMAAYAARAGMRACIYMPKDTPQANIEESRIAGAEVIMVEGLINEAARQASLRAQQEDWFDVSTFKEPYRVEGKKIMGYELAEQFSWCLPEVIIYPTGGGTGLVGMWKAFAELKELGWLEDKNLPRMVVVQAEGCAPVVKAFHSHSPICEEWMGAQTIASGLCVPKSFAHRMILRDLQASHGYAVSVGDAEIVAAQHRLAETEGIFAAPEGAATVAGLLKLIEKNWVRPEERIVLFNTGSGLKYLHLFH